MFDWLFGSDGIEFGSDTDDRKTKLMEFRIKRLEAKLDLILDHLGIQMAGQYFDVVLVSDGGNKLRVVKVVREMTGCSLKDAKDIVEGVPITVAPGLLEDDATVVRSELESAGAIVELRVSD